MANCGFRIFKDGTSYGIGINVSDATDAEWSSYNNRALYVNGRIESGIGYLQLSGQSYPQVQFCGNNSLKDTYTGRIYEAFSSTGTNRLYFEQKVYKNATAPNEYSEIYRLPITSTYTTTSTENVFYDILTTRNLPSLTTLTGTLSIAQGGTGATTSDDAISNLGLARKSFTPTYTTNDLVTDLSGLTIYTVAGIAFLCINMTPTSASNTSFVNIGTVPTGARPPIQVQTRIAQGVSGTQVGFRVTAAGTISLYKGTTSTTGFYGVFSYPVA